MKVYNAVSKLVLSSLQTWPNVHIPGVATTSSQIFGNSKSSKIIADKFVGAEISIKYTQLAYFNHSKMEENVYRLTEILIFVIIPSERSR